MARPESNKSKQQEAARGNLANKDGQRSGSGGVKQRTLLGKIKGK